MDTLVRPKVMPLKLKDLLNTSDESMLEEPPLTDRKRLEPMKIKDLIKSLSGRKNPESIKHVYPSTSVGRKVNVPRKSTISSSSSDVHARRKLYAAQNTPKELNRQSTFKPQPKPIANIDRNQASRKSLLLPRNTIKEYHVHRGQTKENITKSIHEDKAIQTDSESSKRSKNNLTKDIKSTCGCQNEAKRNSEIQITAESLKEIASSTNILNERSTCIGSDQVSKISAVPISAADGTENRINKDSANTQSQVQKVAHLIDDKCLLLFQPLPSNQIFVQVPQTVENQRIGRSIPAINSTRNLGSENIVVDKNNLLAIEEFLKEGIVNMTQALNVVQAMMYSNSLQPQILSTVTSEKECTSTQSSLPVIQNVLNPILESCDTTDIKIEPSYGDTSPPSIISSTKSVSETNCGSEFSKRQSIHLHEMNRLQVMLDDCLLLQPTNQVSSETNVLTTENEKSPDTIENFNLNSTRNCSAESPKTRPEESPLKLAEPTSSKNNDVLLATPKRNLRQIDNNILKTPKTVNWNQFRKVMTPGTKVDDKENFQTPMSRRKSFSGMDSQKLRRSVRIARHHLRQSLGEDSFLALERELDIVYPGTNT